MTNFKKQSNKVWVFAAAATLIAGSSLVMNMILGSVSANASPSTASVEASAEPVNKTQTTADLQLKAAAPGTSVEYQIIDRTKSVYDKKDKIKKRLSLRADLTEEQIEKEVNAILSTFMPGEKDISAEQAASGAADLLKTAFGVNLNGYVAETVFWRGAVPATDNWSVTFSKSVLTEDIAANRIPQSYYYATINSVSGKIIDAGFYNVSTKSTAVNPDGPAWKEKAEQYVTTFLPKDVSIRNSKVVSTEFENGVTVVCELSNGSAYGLRMVGENEEIASCLFFPNGYDGSLEDKPGKGR